MSAIGTKQTWRFALHMSAFDPKRTSHGPFPVQVWAATMPRSKRRHLGALGAAAVEDIVSSSPNVR
jgi:hypothetical protein